MGNDDLITVAGPLAREELELLDASVEGPGARRDAAGCGGPHSVWSSGFGVWAALSARLLVMLSLTSP